MATDEPDPAVAATLAAQAPTASSEGRSSTDETEVESIIADRYAILGLLGAGGMGRVYRAHDRTLDEIVALKVLKRSSSFDSFRQEVKLARRVTSPHVVRTLESGEHGVDLYFTMEYIAGRSLAQVLDEGTPPIDEVLRIASAMAAGIAAAHAAGVLHRDLKPDNVLLGEDGRVAITDFGIAVATTVDAGADFHGTPAYAAPEQIFREAIAAPTDVFAFGTILYEMLVGQRSFTQKHLCRARDRPRGTSSRSARHPRRARATRRARDALHGADAERPIHRWSRARQGSGRGRHRTTGCRASPDADGARAFVAIARDVATARAR